MLELATSRERLQPSLLDRLSDEVRGIEAEIGRVQALLAARLDEAGQEALAGLLSADRHTAPGEAELAPFAAFGSDAVELVQQRVGFEQQRQLELRTRFMLSAERLRACVLRDLTSLLNTESLRWREARAQDAAIAERPDIEDYPNVAASVVNYGIPPLAGRTTLEPDAVAADLEQAIRTFEPRLRAGTVKVRPVGDAQAGHAIAFDIEAELWGEPVPLRLLLRTLIDLEDGAATVRPVPGSQ